MDSEISHEGVVQSVKRDSVMVLLSPGVSCSGCQAEKSCMVSGSEKKLLKIDGAFNLETGDRVSVSMKKIQGYSALFLGYLLPLVIIVVSLVTLLSVSLNELISGLISVGLLLPYYGILFIFRKSINRNFTFTLNRIN